jgi:hypothetical protein
VHFGRPFGVFYDERQVATFTAASSRSLSRSMTPAKGTAGRHVRRPVPSALINLRHRML